MFHQDYSKNRSICLIIFPYMYSAIWKNSSLRGRSGEVWFPKNLWRLGLCVLSFFFQALNFFPFYYSHASILTPLTSTPLSHSTAGSPCLQSLQCQQCTADPLGMHIHLLHDQPTSKWNSNWTHNIIAQREENISLRWPFFLPSHWLSLIL